MCLGDSNLNSQAGFLCHGISRKHAQDSKITRTIVQFILFKIWREIFYRSIHSLPGNMLGVPRIKTLGLYVISGTSREGIRVCGEAQVKGKDTSLKAKKAQEGGRALFPTFTYECKS